MFTRSILRGASICGVAAAAVLCAPAVAQDTVTLKYKWNKGDVVHYRSIADSEGKMSIPGMGERVTTQHQEFVQRFEVKEVAEDGAATIDVTFVSIKLNQDTGSGPPVTFDSTKPGEKQEAAGPMAPAVEVMGALVGEHIQIVMDASGKVRKVEGMIKILDKMQGKIGGANPMVLRNLRNTMGDDAMRGSVERFFRLLPEAPVKQGDTWNTVFEQSIPGLGGRMNTDVTWTFAGMEKKDAADSVKLTSTTKVDVVPPKEGEESGPIPGMKMSIKDGTGTGEALFDPKAGQLLKSVVSVVLPIEMNMSAQGQGMVIKNDTKSTYTTERIAAPAGAPAAPAATPAAPASAAGGGDAPKK